VSDDWVELLASVPPGAPKLCNKSGMPLFAIINVKDLYYVWPLPKEMEKYVGANRMCGADFLGHLQRIYPAEGYRMTKEQAEKWQAQFAPNATSKDKGRAFCEYVRRL